MLVAEVLEYTYSEDGSIIFAQNKDMDRALDLWRDAQQKKPEDQLLIRKIKLKKYLKE